MKRTCCFLVLLLSLGLLVQYQAFAQSYDYPTANLSTTWTADHNGPHNVSEDMDGTFVKAILLRANTARGYSGGPSFACGFYCKEKKSVPCSTFLFAIFIVVINSGGLMTNPRPGIPQVTWSANRDRPVGVGATLQLTADGDLVLKDRGLLVWSTATSGQSVTGMSLDPNGSLRLVDGNGSTVWQSFDHPTDVLLSGQAISGNQRLVANVSVSNWTSNPVLYLSPQGAYAVATPPQQYYNFTGDVILKWKLNPCYLSVANGSARFIRNLTSAGNDTKAASLQFLRFESDGRLRLYEWLGDTAGWEPMDDVFSHPFYKFDNPLGDCAYPTVCGSYGICSDGKERCKCPAASANGSIDAYFTPQYDQNQGFFCNETTPLTCQSSEFHQFLPLPDVNYFNPGFYMENITTPEGCKNACLNNCSCKAAIIHFNLINTSYSSCYLPTKLFSLMSTIPLRIYYNSTTFLKVQTKPRGPDATTNSKKGLSAPVVVGLALGSFVALVLIILLVVAWLKSRKNGEQDDEEEASRYFQLPGMPTRFSYQELTIATDDFSKVLGKGGFATVFEGTLPDGVKVAVKRLEGVQQIAKEFLAEVQIIGRIHHVNLVGLVGFCTDRSHKMLLYEYMGNGSLDRWIFHKAKEGHGLSWELRKKIIYQVAKGLLYLHDECNPKIIHLDIKPQNILLDDDFNAKVSDFGLSKLIDRDESFVMTTMRGTPGYLAPEWLVTSKITDKVDVFSFGVVLVEIICQRRNLDNTQTGDDVHLLKLFNDMAGEGQLNSFIDSYYHGAENHELEAMQMLKLAIWCLQSDAGQRPSMSIVVKVLDETMEIPVLDLNFLSPANRLEYPREIDTSSSAPLMASVLSGPR